MAPVDPPENTIAEIAAADGKTVYYLSHEDGELIEEKYDGDFGIPSDVGVAKPMTNAVYLLLGQDKRAIYCLAEDNTIKDFEFDPEEWEWTEGYLSELAIEAAPETEFAAFSSSENSREVFFQSPSGNIQSVYTKDGRTWELSSHLPETDPALGASLCSLKIGNRFYVFYSHQNCSIHFLVFDGETWKDEMVPASTNNSTISNIYAKLQGSSYLLQFCDAEGNVFLLSDGEIVKLGTVINGRFKKDKDAQADRWPDEIQSNIKWKGMK